MDRGRVRGRGWLLWEGRRGEERRRWYLQDTSVSPVGSKWPHWEGATGLPSGVVRCEQESGGVERKERKNICT